jgi:microcystin-dependent protein
MAERVPVHAGAGPGLTPRSLGEVGGSETVTLTTNQIAAHTHSAQAISDQGDLLAPATDRVLASSGDGSAYYTQPQPPNPPSTAPMANQTIGPFTGGNQPHNNLMPYLGLNFCIALQGIYPPRS